MCLFPASPYAAWRRLHGAALYLNETEDPPPERLLQAVWFHQRLLRHRLRTVDGRALRVLHPGFWNRERGPDFRDAVLQWEGEAARTGDVEIDLHPRDWHGHRHQANPDYQKVVLHVVWEMGAPTGRPTLVLRHVLDAPLADLGAWLGTETAGAFPLELRGHCCRPLQSLDQDGLEELLKQAAALRLQAKAAHFQARARQAGWEQALWEGLFRALGYKQNLWPMLHLAELLPQLNPPAARLAVPVLQARLFGAGGLLPEELTRRQRASDRYVRELWDAWWRDREAFSNQVLPRQLWRLSGQRPANHPHRRLALAAHWLADEGFLQRMEAWGTGALSPKQVPSALFTALRVPVDAFWSWHWTLRSPRLAKPRPLLGTTRATDLAVNVILPWLWIRAVEGKNDRLRQELERRYFAWPAGEDNAILRLARRRLLGREKVAAAKRAAAQQGLLQIVRDFCEHADSLCADCHFPELVRRWPTSGRTLEDL
ncbi:MAG TPA: DUF2851 family protein [Candidatus Saccharimonadales bacterium]|nr:DUF2851 family protein [Candidatus Saccharimonadales bacterium]